MEVWYRELSLLKNKNLFLASFDHFLTILDHLDHCVKSGYANQLRNEAKMGLWISTLLDDGQDWASPLTAPNCKSHR